MKRRAVLISLAVLTALAVVGGAVAYHYGWRPGTVMAALGLENGSATSAAPAAKAPKVKDVEPPAVTVARVERHRLTETVLVTGTLVPRLEILVSPEIDGLRLLDLKADVGDRVNKGDVLATLERAQIEAQLAQRNAIISRSAAQIEQARSQIAQAEAAAAEAAASLERAKPLRRSGHVSESVYDQREAAMRTTQAQLAAARDGLKVAEAAKAEAEALRDELVWRLERTEVKAPRSGVVSRRMARVGGVASAAAEPLFRIIADGEIELDAEIVEHDLARVKPGQIATVDVAGAARIAGRVRLVSPEIDRLTRLGSARILIGDRPDLRIGAFGRAEITTDTVEALAVPAAAVLQADGEARVQLVDNAHVVTRTVRTGLRAHGLVQIVSGLEAGDVVVARSGTFLRHGDAIRPVLPADRISEASR
ncbi:MAG: efflux RND transporter periplasmic adaptor subunit [Hyphomicrobiaceae bacterium]